MLNSGVTVQTSLFDMLTPSQPASLKGWTLRKIDTWTAEAERAGVVHTIRASNTLFSDDIAWDFPAELPEPVRKEAMMLLSPALELTSKATSKEEFLKSRGFNWTDGGWMLEGMQKTAEQLQEINNRTDDVFKTTPKDIRLYEAVRDFEALNS